MRKGRAASPEQKRITCPIYGFQEMMNGKYKLRIIWSLQDGPRRYGEIKKGLLRDITSGEEIAPRVLSRELKTLAAYGLIKRIDYHLVPPKVEYSLTPDGQSLLTIMTPIVEWGKQHLVGKVMLPTNEA